MATCPNIDWSTFTFIAATGQTLNSATDLTATNGDVIFNQATKQIEYTIDTQNCNVDMVQYKVKDVDGNWSNIATWYIDFEDVTAPVATNDSLTIAAGETKTLNLSTNDTGDINLTSYEILTTPSECTVVNNGDGTVTITASEAGEGSDSFTYRMYNTNGLVSNTATVNLTIQSAGTGTTATICGVSGVNLTTFLTGDVTSGGSWTASGSNPSSPSIATPTSVDFSSANAGTYQFTYTVGDSSATITLLLPAYGVTITSVSTPTNNPIAATTTSLVSFTTVGITNINNIELEVEIDAGGSPTYEYYPPDKWNSQTGEGTIVIQYSGANTYDLTITATDPCGDDQTDTWATITIT